MKCAACLKSTSKIGRKNGTDLYRCQICASIMADCSEPDESFYEQSYFKGSQYGYEENVFSTTNLHSNDSAAQRRLAHLGKSNKVVEVGAGTGSFVRLATDQGFSVIGVERSAYMRRIAQDHHHIELQASVPKLPNEVVTLVLIEVIEHARHPSIFLKNIISALGTSPQIILLTTPNAEAVQILGTEWSQVKPPEHLVLFTWRGLSEMLTKMGYGTFSFHFYHSVFLQKSIEWFGSRSARKRPFLWRITGLLRIVDKPICALLPKRFSLGMECRCTK